MKIFILLALSLLTLPLSAQTGKNVTPLPTQNSNPNTQNSTRAVVVGISDYQHKSIPDLQFANRDAEAFAGWLASPAGGSVPADSIIVLLDNNATAGKVITALGWLVEASREGDLVLIYFSGHGDIENMTFRQNGYLLCHDAPATTYPAGGCLPLGYLQDIVSTLSLQNKARVVLVTDACHAGKLAGSTINGTQTTNAALARQFANEVKVMSCQESELALEGEQWGGGRGLFSFHLIEGLTGFADHPPADGMVTLREIRRYLEDHVTAEAAPHPQTPFVLGEQGFPLARVDAADFAALQQSKAAGKVNFQKTDPRGFASAVVSGQDSAIYLGFLAALERSDFLEPADNCAEFFYQKLLQNPSLGSLHGLLRRNYAAALQDEVQQAINALLDNDPYEANTWNFHPEKYSQYPAYLTRSIELLGDKHYMAASLKSKKAYFEGYEIAKTFLVAEPNPARRDSLREAAKQKYLEAINYDPDAAYLYFAIGDLYLLISPYQTDSLVLWCRRALERSPAWVTPALEIAYEYQSAQQRIDLEEKWILEAQKILPNSYLVMERMAWLRQWQGRRDEAVEMCEKMIAQKPDLFNGYATLALTIFHMDGDFKEMEKQARKAVEVYPHFSNWAYPALAYSLMGMRRRHEAIDLTLKIVESNKGPDNESSDFSLVEQYSMVGDYEKAEQYANRALEKNLVPYFQAIVLLELGKIRVHQNRLPEAIALFERSSAVNPSPDANRILVWAWLGEVARLQNKPAEAEAFFRKALVYRSGSGWEEMAKLDEAYYRYGNFLLCQNRLDEAASAFQKSVDMRRKGFWGEYGFALLAARKGDKTAALDWLEKSLDNWYPDAESILAEPLFAKIRHTKRFKTLLSKHFPETTKQ